MLRKLIIIPKFTELLHKSKSTPCINHLKCLSTKSPTDPSTAQLQSISNDWTTIYKFPAIKLVSSFNKSKIYQSALTGAGVPILMALESSQFLPANSAEVFAYLGTKYIFFFFVILID